ncbi:MAG: hypothetical protein R3B57_14465 [Phycisphaerales bacterium]
MAGVTKTVVRVGLLAALAGGALIVVAGPEGAHALFNQARANVGGVINSVVDDPIALRAQLKNLEAEYPKKIADVRTDLGELQGQIAEMERELAVSQKVVELAGADLSRLDGTLTEARSVQAENPGALIRVVYNDRPMGLEDAYGKRTHIQQTRDIHQTRVTELTTDLGYLHQQEDQLGELLTKLETERSEFQTQLFQLDAQIDSVARNDRMITMMEKRQATIDEHSRFEAHSLDQIRNRLKSKLDMQRQELASIAVRDRQTNYEDTARYLLDQQNQDQTPSVSPAPVRGFTIQPHVIEVPEASARGPMASRD